MTSSQNVQIPASALSRACDNPECTSRVDWSERPGRPQTFCTPTCRQRARHAASRLQADLQRLEQERLSEGVTYRQRRELDAVLAQKRWLLSSYPVTLQS